jgi:tetratricopeptide (TPR) repeat protein
MRIINFRSAVYGREAMMWSFRLGLRQPWGRQAAHGLHHMTHNEHTLTNHPDWFALYGGKRHTEKGQRLNQLCYSNQELLQQSVRFAQKQFDHYDMDVVSIMPPDGYTAICQCKLCQGKDDPQRGYRGALSDYVWQFVNEVAKEVGKTHPDKKISNGAYGTYTQPPQNIDKLEPNVQVIIVGGRRPTSSTREELRRLRKDWSTKTDNPVEIFENYPFTSRGFYLPAYIPRTLGESINETKGISRGEDIWLSMDFGENAIGYNHFLIYFTARMYWGGNEQDPVKMFDEYCRLFYGPVASEMKAFFNYCERHWTEMEKDAEIANHALKLFTQAKDKTVAGSIYAKRITLIDNYLNGLRNKSIQLAQKRGPVPRVRLVGGEPLEPIVVDGKFDDTAWEKCATASTGRFGELQTGRQPIFETSFKTTWQKGSVYFAIRCEERAGEKLNIATTKNGDQAIWYGDAVEILLATNSHSYYQIAVNPAGALIDLDRGASRNNWFNWTSKAEVATRIENDHWTVEIRIPVIQDENDPLHQVIGHKPTQSLPWHINVCRQRIRSKGSEHSAFVPTSKLSFHAPMKFGHFYSGQSHEFPADETVSDYIIMIRKADALARRKQDKEAAMIYESLAVDKDATDFQKSAALRQAARCARSLRQFDRAEELALEIPITSIAKTVQMENLLTQRSFDNAIEKYGSEDLEQWPFTQIGTFAFLRAKAYAAKATNANEDPADRAKHQAETDFVLALRYTSDNRARSSILVNLAANREFHLKNDDEALAAYRKNFAGIERIGSADQFRSLQGAARILTRKSQFDRALAVLERAKIETLSGFWRNELLLSRGHTYSVANRKADALRSYELVLKDKSAVANHLKEAKKNLEQLGQK